jgi:hypothetical protein
MAAAGLTTTQSLASLKAAPASEFSGIVPGVAETNTREDCEPFRLSSVVHEKDDIRHLKMVRWSNNHIDLDGLLSENWRVPSASPRTIRACRTIPHMAAVSMIITAA